jgi:branched-chain amino acid transport system ATP-binding protein
MPTESPLNDGALNDGAMVVQVPSPLLRVESVSAGYGGVDVIHDVSLSLEAGGFYTVVGSNGAGKSTLLKTISGLIHPSSGKVIFEGRDISGDATDRIVRSGLVHVAEGRRLFRSQSVRKNLELGLYRSGIPRSEEEARFEEVLTLFPVLARKHKDPAGILSGGEQQMLAIGQALMRKPRLLMLDEPSLGLAPVIIDQVLDTLVGLHDGGTTLLLVEQVVERALEVAGYGYVMQNGRIVTGAPASELIGSEVVREAYVGNFGDSPQR